ncbi:50S ribosomal protein L23 [Argonema galeatum]|uniref:50S ribosomal protein L23 n=1 Tax=Argonema galeatum TaxID=2942762 RepID=UPI00201211AE|nr:50S ribosomal protein L23 [Argonema galeatum A003/A1]
MAEYNLRTLADLIRRPLLTEKATMLMEQEKYSFDVVLKATKPQIKAAIEQLFDVKVTAVNTMTPPRKKRRVGRFLGYKSQYKKAVVTLASGDGEKIRQILFPEV